MSTLAAARADNFYYPPNFDPKKGGLNKQQGQHPLRERAKKLDEGILVIRFEMPFNVWCEGCQHLIGKGVRFNAEKKQIGNYHSTKIWSFSMRSPCCQTRIEVHTDPKNCEYQVVAGARRKAEAYTAKDAGVMELDDPEEAAAAARDPFTKLERGDADKRKAKEAAQQLIMLVADNKVKHRDDYTINKELRRRNRGLRKEEAARDEHRQRLNLPDSITLAPQSEQDRQVASLVVFGQPARFDKKWRERRRAIHHAPIFAPAASHSSSKAPAAQSSTGLSRGSSATLPSGSLPALRVEAPSASVHHCSTAGPSTDAHPSAGSALSSIHHTAAGCSQRGDALRHQQGLQSAGNPTARGHTAQTGNSHPGHSLPLSSQHKPPLAATPGRSALSLGLKASGVQKHLSAMRKSGSKSGRKHGLMQAGKLSRIRLGAKLVLGDVPA